MKFYTTLILLLTISLLSSQNINNNILGKYVTKDKTQLYSSFSFDNNGKVEISEFSYADYFKREDTIIVFPDKSIFKFLIKKNEIIGISEWVKNGKWTLTKDSVIDNRKDSLLALKNAELNNEYYLKTRMSTNQMEMLFDENLQKEYLSNIERLCDRGLIRACKEIFGMATLAQMGGLDEVLKNEKHEKLQENPILLGIANNVLKLDSSEGYNLLFLYYSMISQQDKANEAADRAIALGNKDAIMTKMNMELEKASNEFDKKTFEPLLISTLRHFNQQSFADFEQDLYPYYGFKLIGKSNTEEGETRDYEDEKFNRITVFKYKDTKRNKVEYTPLKIEDIDAFKKELENYTMKETINAETGLKREDYTYVYKQPKGNVENSHVQIIYLNSNKQDGPISVVMLE